MENQPTRPVEYKRYACSEIPPIPTPCEVGKKSCPLFRNTRQPLDNFTPSPGKSLTLGARLSYRWSELAAHQREHQENTSITLQSVLSPWTLGRVLEPVSSTDAQKKKAQIFRPGLIALVGVPECPRTKHTSAKACELSFRACFKLNQSSPNDFAVEQVWVARFELAISSL